MSATPGAHNSASQPNSKQIRETAQSNPHALLASRRMNFRDAALCVTVHSGGVAMRFRFTWSLVVYFLVACIPLLAHHGGNNYDTSKAVVLKGATVTKWSWINPHVIVMVDVKDAQGNVQHWSAEASSPSTLQLKGWSQASFQPGDVITIYLYQSKTGRPVGRLNKIVLADGTELHDGQQGGKDVE